MNDSSQIAKHVRDVHFGGNWTGVNLTDALADINWEEATKKIYSLNTIAALVFHMNYYVDAVLNVLHGKPLTASDKYSFDAPPIQSEDDWKTLTDKTWRQASELADLIDKLPDTKLTETFVDEKYGTYYRNLHGIVEHIHYHLGQIVLIKKLLRHTDQ
ncbi:MAG TPA: DinB family protein [Parafilimonas sp.]|nr:DinB family protein [Parafilimonas sp.]